jgi:hypothetical protein
VTAVDVGAGHGQTFALSDLVAPSDADGDAIVSYEIVDKTAQSDIAKGISSVPDGHFFIHGSIVNFSDFTISSADFAAATFVAGSGPEDIMVRASDGFDQSAWKEFHVNAPENHAPVLTAADVTANHGDTFAASSLFSVSDADVDTMTQYQFLDVSAPANGYFSLGGTIQNPGQAFTVTAAQLPQLQFHRGAGQAVLEVRTFDAYAWSVWKTFRVSGPLDSAPVVTAPNVGAAHGQSFSASSLFTVADAEGDAMTQYQFVDQTSAASSGYFTLGGVAQSANLFITVSAAQLPQFAFQSGSGADTLKVRAFDGLQWSAWVNFTVTAPIDQAPVVTAADINATHGQTVTASSLFTMGDADHDQATKYEFFDKTATVTSGRFTVNGVNQAAGKTIDVSAADLAQTSFVSGSGTDDLLVRAFDGSLWSA